MKEAVASFPGIHFPAHILVCLRHLKQSHKDPKQGRNGRCELRDHLLGDSNQGARVGDCVAPLIFQTQPRLSKWEHAEAFQQVLLSYNCVMKSFKE